MASSGNLTPGMPLLCNHKYLCSIGQVCVYNQCNVKSLYFHTMYMFGLRLLRREAGSKLSNSWTCIWRSLCAYCDHCMYIGLRAADVQGKGWIAVSRSCSFRVRQWVNLPDNNYDEFSRNYWLEINCINCLKRRKGSFYDLFI